MRFRVDQVLPGTVDEVLAAFTDPAYYDSLADLARTDPPRLLERRVEGDLVHLRVRYRFTGNLAAPVRTVVDPARLVWVVEQAYDLVRHSGTFRVVPEHYADRLRCRGTERFREAPDGSVRTVETELQVKAPIVGAAVERGIAMGFEEHLREEADAIGRWLDRSR